LIDNSTALSGILRDALHFFRIRPVLQHFDTLDRVPCLLFSSLIVLFFA
jgi:hypothetical protein